MTSCTSSGDAALAGVDTPLPDRAADRLPILGLLALAMAGFITVLTEAMPAGLLRQMGAGLGVSEALAGQLVTIYAIGSLATAIPLATITQSVRRRTLLLVAVAGFAIVNLVTALSDSYSIILVARFCAGVFAGLLWSLLAGYASRMAPPHLAGRAIAIALFGTAAAFSLGVPIGTFLGTIVGWRIAFVIISGLALLLIGWILATVPDFPGQAGKAQFTLARVFRMPRVRPVLFVTFAYVFAHNILFTYIAPYLVPAGMADSVGTVLLLFGVISLVGIWGVGLLVDRWLDRLTLLIILLFGSSALILGLGGTNPAIVYGATALWGLAYSGAPTLFQTASAKAAGEAADIAQAMIVTVWNLAIAAGGIVGGILLETLGVVSFPWAILALLAVTFLVVARAGRS